ncbi:MAG: right-handed parallel beta-helix repeat-containing protein [Bdellovibrionota bacterium]
MISKVKFASFLTLGALAALLALSPAHAATFTVNSADDDGTESVSNEVLGTGNGSTATFTGTLDNFPVRPGTVSVDDQSETLNDNEVGQLLRFNNDEDVGTGNGALTTFTGTISNTPIEAGSVSITDTSATLSDNEDGYFLGAAVNNETLHAWSGSETSFSETLNNPPVVPGTIRIDPAYGNGDWFYDDGEGNIVKVSYYSCCQDLQDQVFGTVNYTTGAVTLDIGDYSDFPSGTSALVDYTRSAGTVDYTTGAFSVTFAAAPANLQDILADYNHVTGTVNYDTGAVTVTFDANTGNGDDVEVDYEHCGESCTLRAAIEIAAAKAGDDTITFSLPNPSVIAAGNGEFDCIPDNLTITGPGSGNLMVNAAGADGDYLFRIDSETDINASECPGAGGTTVTMTGMTISGTSSYAAVYAAAKTNLVLDDVVITGNRRDCNDEDGGALVINGSATLTDVTVSDNLSPDNSQCDGAGIYIAGESGEVTLDRVVVTNNTRRFDGSQDVCGGGIYIGGFAKDVSLNRVTVDGNTLNVRGASNSSQEHEGAGICINGTSHNVVIENSVISNNRLLSDIRQEDDKGGGGIGINGTSSNVLIRNTRIEGNSSETDGGGVVITAGRVAFENVSITDNHAAGRRDTDGSEDYLPEMGGGGGIALQGKSKTVELISSTVSGNSSDYHGGGIHIQGAPWTEMNQITLLGSSVTNNEAGGYGGGINAWSGLAELVGGSVSGNHANSGGGGVANFKDMDDDCCNDIEVAFWNLTHLGRVGQIRIQGGGVGGNTVGSSAPDGTAQCYGSLSIYGGGGPGQTELCQRIAMSGVLPYGFAGGGGGCELGRSSQGAGSLLALFGAVAVLFLIQYRRRGMRIMRTKNFGLLAAALTLALAVSVQAATILVDDDGDDGVESVTDEVLGTGNGTQTTFTGTLDNGAIQPGTVNVDDQTESLNDNANGQILRNIQDEIIGTGDGTETEFSGTLANTPIEPDSVSVTDGTTTFNDNEDGYLIATTGAVFNEETMHTFNGVETSFSAVLDNPPVVPGSFDFHFVNCCNYNTSEFYQDDGLGNIVVIDVSGEDEDPTGHHVIGTINYATGLVIVDLGTFSVYPENGNPVRADYTRYSGTVDYTTGAIAVEFPGAVGNGTDVIVDYDTHTGTVNYQTGAISVTFDAATGNADDVQVDYSHCGATCTLRAAIEVANAGPTADIINFSLTTPATITLTNGEFDCVPDSLTINGPGSANLTIDVDGTDGNHLFMLESSPDGDDCSGEGGATVSIKGLTITGADDSAPIHSTAKNHLILNDVVVDQNTPECGSSNDDESGGQIIINGTAELTNVTVSDNTVDTTSQCEAAGISIAGEGGKVTLRNVTVSGNQRIFSGSNDNCGGGISISGFAKDVKLTNVTVDGNTLDVQGASDYEYEGAGICVNGTSHNVVIENSTISNNTLLSDTQAEDDKGGAGIGINGTSSMVLVRNTRIEDNESDTDGGGIVVTAGDVVLEGVTISGNTAHGRNYENYELGGGGGIAVQGKSKLFQVINSTITGNTSDFHGGGIHVQGAPWTEMNQIALVGTSVRDNSAVELGGGVSAWSGLVDIVGSSVTGNDATAGGGGVSNYKDPDFAWGNDEGFWDLPHLGRVGMIRLQGASIGGNMTSGVTDSDDCYGSVGVYTGGAPAEVAGVCEPIRMSGLLPYQVLGGSSGCELGRGSQGTGSIFILLAAVAVAFGIERRRRQARS